MKQALSGADQMFKATRQVVRLGLLCKSRSFRIGLGSFHSSMLEVLQNR
jgi:hypothetical protein